jgi:hypothetical protein
MLAGACDVFVADTALWLDIITVAPDFVFRGYVFIITMEILVKKYYEIIIYVLAA